MESLHWLWSKRKEILRGAILVVVGLTAIFNVVLRPAYHARGIASSRATGVAAEEEWAATSFWRSSTGLVGDAQQLMTYVSASLEAAPSDQLTEADTSRKVAHTSDLTVIVNSPGKTADKIRVLAEHLGGYLLTSQFSGKDSNYASISIRVPVAQAEEAKAEIRKLAIHVESENTEAEDVTKQWVDTDARLRNLRATEQQYLQILKRAASVKDTLEVSEKLGEIRGQIELQQAEFAALAKRVETVAISVSLRPDADIQVFGLHWRALYRAKLSFRNAVDALGDYSATMFEVILRVPVIALWLITLVAFAAIGWRLLRWAARIFFGWKVQSKA